MSNNFISPLDDDVFKGLYGDQKNIANTVDLLKPILGIPPEEFEGLALVNPSLRRRWMRRKEKTSWASWTFCCSPKPIS
ncbi:MAG: hypothetical protein LBK63_11050 [Treponema sp.]|jgi:hypothetical protein|nr:hypothetical protein [Treponema sp.]